MTILTDRRQPIAIHHRRTMPKQRCRQHLWDALGHLKLSLTQVAKQTGFSAGTVSAYVHRLGVPIPSQRLDIDRDDVVELIEQGLTVFQIAAELGCGHTTVERRLTAFGLSTRRRRNLPIDKRELTRLVRAGWTQTQMADHFGCGPSTIDRRLRRYGLRTARAGRT
jgi:IS30 family transposase